MSTSTQPLDCSPTVRRHEVEVTATHAEFACEITCSRDGREPISDVVPYEVEIKVDLRNCTFPNEVVYQLNDEPQGRISAGGSVTIFKRTRNDDTLQLWYQECVAIDHSHGASELGEVPKTPRVTLTLTKKGDD
jgi:hypothetical protein